MTVCNSDLNIKKCISQSKSLIDKDTISKRELESMLVLINFLVDYIADGRSTIHPLIKYSNSEFNFFSDIDLQITKKDNLNPILEFWTKPDHFLPVSIRVPFPTITLKVDASKSR